MERTTLLVERKPIGRHSDSGFRYVTYCDASRECLEMTSQTVSGFDRGRYRAWKSLRLTRRCSELSGGVAFSDHHINFRQPVR